MNNKIVKTIDEHNIDRNANVMFAFDLEGSEYVSYKIERDGEQDNLFVSKVIKNIDGTFNMVSVEEQSEKSKLNNIVMALVKSAVENPADKISGDSVTLSDGKVIKFIPVNFNKEQKIEVRKTYVTTVKKEVSRVAEKYYSVDFVVEQPNVVDDIFPTVMPVVDDVKEEIKVVEPVVVQPSVVTPDPVSVVESPIVQSQPVSVQTSAVEVAQPSVVAVQPQPVVVEPITNPEPVSPVMPVLEKVEPTPVVVEPQPVPASVSNVEPQPLVFNAANETNLNAALGEVASTTTIPVENIEPVREFGIEAPTPVVQPQPVPVNNEADVSSTSTTSTATSNTTKKAGFANSKFFMVVAIAFFLASCIFLGYEVFNYFQLTK